jgi:hypothetical protein
MAGANVGDAALGKTRLLTRQCSTCIMRAPSDGRIPLPNARVSEFVRSTVEAGSYVVCHSTLTDGEPAVCRGFADRYDTPQLQLIRRLWGFVEVDPPTPGGVT